MSNQWVAITWPGMRTERSIELPVEPEALWSALVDDDLLSDWLGDEAHLDPDACRPGRVSADGRLVMLAVAACRAPVVHRAGWAQARR